MTDDAHVQTKSQQSLADSQSITVVQFTNPTSDDIANYNTAIDPSSVNNKNSTGLDVSVVDLSNEPIPLWYSKYATGVEASEIFFKSTIFSDGQQVIMLGDQPYAIDIGPTVDVPALDQEPSLEDEWHKIIVTDLSPDDVTVVSGVSTPAISTMSMYNMIREAQYMLFPVSSRHICKTSDGAIHAVVSYSISGLSRIVYLKSINGGESWSSTIVDNDDGCDYVLPSITCDSADGIHITWNRWRYVVGYTYWLFAGTTIPDGFEHFSDGSADWAYKRLLFGSNGTVSALYGDDVEHDHNLSMSGGACSVSSSRDPGSSNTIPRYGWHHTTVDVGDCPIAALPKCKTIKLIRYNGFPNRIPVDVVLLFDTASIPEWCTRYSDLDDRFIYLDDSIGLAFGSDTHNHTYTYDVSGSTNNVGIINPTYWEDGSPFAWAKYTSHTHSGSYTYPTAASNNPPGYTVVLGKVDTEQTAIPQHAIIMCDSNGVIDASLPFTCLSDVGGELYNKYLKGGTSYASVSGSLSHAHGSITDATTACSNTGVHLGKSGYIAVTVVHQHSLTFVCEDADNNLPSFGPHMYHTDAEYDVSTTGNDIFYCYIDSSGDAYPIVPVTEYHNGIHQSFECTCLCDLSDTVHFLWVSRGINATLTNPRVCYRQMVNGVLGSIEYPTTDDVACIYPSFDIDSDGCVHACWGVTSSTAPKIQYCKRESSWGSVEDVDTTQFVGFPSNVVVDRSGNVYVSYAVWSNDSTKISDVYYAKRTSSWQTPVNLSSGKAAADYNQFPGQLYIDNKDNVFITFSGKGYGAHLSVYHPVYRYITSAGTLVPASGLDAVDLFPDDDYEIIYPTVFWHTFPFIGSVYHNFPVSGMTFMYLYNVRGADLDTADIKFYSSDNALVGDVGVNGVGGSGESEFTPSGICAESLLQFESFSVVIRGHLGKTSFMNEFGGYIV